MKLDHIKILNKGALIATFTAIKDDGIEFRECKFFRQNGKSWINFPSKEYEKNGQKKYWAYIKLPDSLYEAFQNDAKKAFEEYEGKNKSNSIVIDDTPPF